MSANSVPFVNTRKLILVVLLALLGLSPLRSLSATTLPQEFTLPISASERETWPGFVGVGYTVYYPSGWKALSHRSQGGVKDGTKFDFLWMKGERVFAKVEVLEIISSDDARLLPELAYWQQQATTRSYTLEQVTVQGHHGWWIQAVEPQEITGLTASLLVDWEERMFIIRLRCQPEVQEESVLQLRRMLSTLKLTEVDWNRAPDMLPALSLETTIEEMPSAPTAPLAASYYANAAAVAYAEAYHDVKANDDGCYVWTDGNNWDCSQVNANYYEADGAHFVNRAVTAGGRPIPALPDSAALNVSGLRDWLTLDGWVQVAASAAEPGDVVIIGPYDNPCWAGLVVVAGSDPMVTTHSDELRAPASDLSCDLGSQKAYLHTELGPPIVYLPIVVRNWSPPPMKRWTGMHLGNRETEGADWLPAMLAEIDGDNGGIWPRAVVVQSKQIYNVWRPPDPPCEVAGAGVWSYRESTYNYLKRASLAGVKVIIRVAPSPGNFEDWDDPTRSNHQLRSDTAPAGGDYCGLKYDKFRAIDDVAAEMHAIHTHNQIDGWVEYGFEPANEPNTEWYSLTIGSVTYQDPEAWQDMNDYFVALYDHVHEHYSGIRVLTPPMAQTAYAEGINIEDTVTPCGPLLVSTSPDMTGYDYMWNT